jgi:predicted RNA binding protein YcfA (HicA-like mRNA interferase family)
MGRKDDVTRCKTATELVAYAQSHGGAVVRQSGSHAIVQGPGGGTCPVPMHRGDLPTGTRCSILKRFRTIGLVMLLAFLLLAYLPGMM